MLQNEATESCFLSDGMLAVCSSGYDGERCQVVVDHCVSQPCQSGATCFSSLAGPRCLCPEGRERPAGPRGAASLSGRRREFGLDK